MSAVDYSGIVLGLLTLLCGFSSTRSRSLSLVRPDGGEFQGRSFSVEVLVVVDKMAYTQWLSFQNGTTAEEKDQQAVTAIQDYITANFAAANLIWKGMEEYSTNVDLRIHDIVIVKDEVIMAPDRRGRAATNDATFWAFFRWLIRNGYEFDHATLFTGLDLVSPYVGGDSEGYAYMDTMCTVESISIVEMIVNGIPAVVMAHEIGHSFGARHDGTRNSCDPNSGFLMNDDNIGTSPQHWRFSSCSASKITGALRNLTQSYDCLSGGSTTKEPVTGPYLGQLYTADQLCQKTEGSHSYVCRHLYPGGADAHTDTICDTLWCLVNRTYCVGTAPVDGLPCGGGKRCRAGQCVAFDDVSDEVTDTCYTGDIPHPAWQNQTCGEVVESYTHMCKDAWYKDFCCLTCQRAYTGNDDCPYGDANQRCAPFYCGTRWEGECCETCPPRR